MRLDLKKMTKFTLSLLCRALADYINPAIQIDGNNVYFAPWRIPSGSYLTALGNTRRHRFMSDWVVTYIEKHGGYGREDCNCFVCERFGVGPRVTEFEIELLRAFFILGDDYIAICKHPLFFNRILDFVFKTCTKTEEKLFFCTPENPNGAEFLKKKFCLIKGVHYQVRIFREPIRVLAKLYHGSASANPAKFYAALLSAIWDSGYNPKLQDILHGWINGISARIPSVQTGWREFREFFEKKTPSLSNNDDVFVPSIHDVVNMDSSMIRPAMRVVMMNASKKAGTRVSWYN